jgi:hypothetical protein
MRIAPIWIGLVLAAGLMTGAVGIGIDSSGWSGGAIAQQAQTSPQIRAAEQEIIVQLEKAGYTDVRDIKSTAEGIVAKAKKDGKEVTVISDSSGNVRER